MQPIIDGIFYESSQGRVDDRLKDCISVALKPQSVDTKLHFLGVYDVLIKMMGRKLRFLHLYFGTFNCINYMAFT